MAHARVERMPVGRPRVVVPLQLHVRATQFVVIVRDPGIVFAKLPVDRESSFENRNREDRLAGGPVCAREPRQMRRKIRNDAVRGIGTRSLQLLDPSFKRLDRIGGHRDGFIVPVHEEIQIAQRRIGFNDAHG